MDLPKITITPSGYFETEAGQDVPWCDDPARIKAGK